MFTIAGLKCSHKCGVKMLKTRIKPNTSSTLNVQEKVTLPRLQQVGRLLWVQIIYNHLVIMTRTKAVTPTMPNNIYYILEFAGVPIRMFLANFGPEHFNWTLPAPLGEGRPIRQSHNKPREKHKP